MAIKRLLPKIEASAIEINVKAVEILKQRISNIKVYNQSILDFNIDYKRDLVVIKGVLIHINPDELQKVYQKLYEASQNILLYVNTTILHRWK